MRRGFASLLAAALVAPVLAQPPAGSQPPPTPQPAPTGAPASTGGGMTLTPVTPPKPAGIPVPDGPVVNKQELEGGLLVEDIKIGTGYQVTETAAVVAHYHGTLKADGSVFDSSFERGEPATFPLNGVIAGWQKGVPGMKVGGIRKLTIPAAMAYGAQARPKIPANSDLVFVIQLVDALETEDLKVGTGEEAEGRFVAVTAYTLRDSTGKEVEKFDASKPYVWIPGEMNKPGSMVDAIQAGMAGMKVGGKRKIRIPKEMNGAPPQMELTRPLDVPIELEVELLACRNLQPKKSPTPPPPPRPAVPTPTGATGVTGATGPTGH